MMKLRVRLEEVWKTIPEFEGVYEASSLGRIRSLSLEAYRNEVRL